MAYLEQGNWRDRPLAVAGVVAIHAGIGLVLVNGFNIVTRIVQDEDVIGIQIKADPIVEPPIEDPKPQPKRENTRPFVPDPVIEIDTARPIVDPVPLPSPIPDTIFIPEPLPTAKPSLGLDPVAARPANDRASWVTTGDYPARDIRQENEGVTGFRVVVGTDGRVKSCEITSSSGFATLDQATCRNVEKRARFDAARDANGEKVVGTYSSKVRWQIPD